MPDPGPSNLKLLTAALEALDTRFGGLDVVQRLRGVPAYSELAKDVVESDLENLPED